jgi:hypothetical protein
VELGRMNWLWLGVVLAYAANVYVWAVVMCACATGVWSWRLYRGRKST